MPSARYTRVREFETSSNLEGLVRINLRKSQPEHISSALLPLVDIRRPADCIINMVGFNFRQGQLPISSSRAESTVGVLVNARMNKLRQMRWSPRAQRVLRARAAVIDGRLTVGVISLAA